MSNAQDDAVFIRNFSLVLIALVVVGVICFILAKIVNAGFEETQVDDQSASRRIAPAGSANVGEPMMVAGSGGSTTDTSSESTSADPSDPGAATYGKICFSCHDAGIAGAPKTGDSAAWTSRLEKGTEMVVSNAINGFQGETGIMPARGGLPDLSDDDVRAAVMHMLAALEGEASAAPAESAAPAAAVVETPTAAPAVTPEPAAHTPAVADGRGKEVYDAACFICHASGVAGAPKFGDAANWASRLDKGMDTLYKHSIEGFMGESGLMPPKGGRPDFNDDDVKAAVDYMVNSAK